MAFKKIKSCENAFIDGALHLYMHEQTKCEVLHISNADPENVFLFAVPTYPKDDTGITHILEHSVLSGSERYQVKSPFFMLEQGSCRTYLNASTYPDRTLYPGASLLKEDLFNLMAMSGDALWYPLLKEAVFRQEGFHFLFDEQQNPQAAGVVYNEMKGAYSDKFTIIEHEISKLLFPDTEYQFDSGGTPMAIPQLRYENFMRFYKNYYRPEHTKILLYGNIPSDEYLSFIENELLTRWKESPQEPEHVISLQTHKNLVQYNDENEERIHLIPVPSSEHAGGEEGSLDITWLLGDACSIEEVGLLRFAHFALLGIPGAPLRKMIMESDLVEDISPLSGFNTYLRQSSYTIGAVGIAQEHYGTMRNLIFEGLQQIVNQGIAEDITQAALSRIEFAFKERLNSTSGKVGWLSGLASKWLYGQEPFVYADVPAMVHTIKTALKTPRALERFIQEQFIDNLHRAIVGTIPQQAFETINAEKEAQMLNELFMHEGREYWQQMYNQVQTLTFTPDSEEQIQLIPKIHKEELPTQVEQIPYEIITLPHSGNLVQWISHNDNGVVYITAHFDVSDMIFNEIHRFLLPTFSAALTDIGVQTIKYEDLSIQICLATGRMGAHINNFIHIDGSSRSFVNIRISVLEERQEKAFKLLTQIMQEAHFDNTARLKEIISEGKAMMKSRMSDAGTMLAVITAAKNFSYNAHLDDDWNGISQLRWLLALEDYQQSSSDLLDMRNVIFTRDRAVFTVVGAERLQQETLARLDDLVASLASKHIDTHKTTGIIPEGFSNIRDSYGIRIQQTNLLPFCSAQAIILPSQVAYNALVIPAVGFDNKEYAFHNLCARVISEKLLEEIRMAYGSYGAHATVLGDESLLVCYTYRDPNIKETFAVFQKVIEDVAKGNFTSSALDSHIVGAVGESLTQLSPQAKSKVASARIFTGITDQKRQLIRDNLLRTKKFDVCKVAQQYVEHYNQVARVSVCSSEMAAKHSWDKIEYAPH